MQMQFYNNRTNRLVQNQNQQVPMVNTPRNLRQVTLNSESQPTVSGNNAPTQKKMKWGEPTWFLFHTLAQKVKDEHFAKIRLELLQIISMICSNLPCPMCSTHATQYIKKMPFYSIQTKQGLKDMLYQFHNEVSKNKNLPQFPYDELDAKYSSANTMNIIQNFLFYFQDKSKSIRMIADDMHRLRMVNTLKTWFSENIKYFDL